MQINYQKGAIVGMNDSNFRIEDGGRVTYFDIIDYTKSHLFRWSTISQQTVVNPDSSTEGLGSSSPIRNFLINRHNKISKVRQTIERLKCGSMLRWVTNPSSFSYIPSPHGAIVVWWWWRRLWLWWRSSSPLPCVVVDKQEAEGRQTLRRHFWLMANNSRRVIGLVVRRLSYSPLPFPLLWMSCLSSWSQNSHQRNVRKVKQIIVQSQNRQIQWFQIDHLRCCSSCLLLVKNLHS